MSICILHCICVVFCSDGVVLGVASRPFCFVTRTRAGMEVCVIWVSISKTVINLICFFWYCEVTLCGACGTSVCYCVPPLSVSSAARVFQPACSGGDRGIRIWRRVLYGRRPPAETAGRCTVTTTNIIKSDPFAFVQVRSISFQDRSPVTLMRLVLLLVPCVSLLWTVSASLDDDAYVDYSFSCPLQTDPTVAACDQVCVADSASCPPQLQCDAGVLCADGSCAVSCPSDAENPCEEYDGLTTACYMDGFAATASDCSDTFSAEYAAMDAAAADDDDYYGDIVPPAYPGFVAFYCWMGFITFAAFMFFAYNNKISPIGEVKDFVPEGAISIYIHVSLTVRLHNPSAL